MSILDNTTAALALATVGIDAGLPVPHHVYGTEHAGGCLIVSSLDAVYLWAVFVDRDVVCRDTVTVDGATRIEHATVTTEWDGVTVEVTSNQRTKVAAS